MLSVHCRFER